MAKSNKEIFNDKVSLIYEYNKKSPLFARAANTEIEKNNLEKAVSIIQNGLKIYPDYPAAYMLLGKVHTLLGNYGQALKNYRIGCDLINSKKTFDFYVKELENIKRQRSLFDNNTKNAFLFVEEEEIPKDKNISSDFEAKPGSYEEPDSVEQRLGEIAQKISEAKIPEETEKEEISRQKSYDFSESNLIVSETLAKIYINQGEYFEAIEVYKRLMKKNPQKSEYYSQKINAVKSELES